MRISILLVGCLLTFSSQAFDDIQPPANDEDSLENSNVTYTKYYKHNVWKHRHFEWDDEGNKLVVEKVNWFQFHKLKEWDSNGNLLRKEKNYPYGWDRGKSKKWIYSYHDNGQLKSKIFVHYKKRILKAQTYERYDEAGKQIEKKETFTHK